MASKKWLEENKEKVRKSRREWYHRNKEQSRAKVKERKDEIVKWYKDYKSTLKCHRCSENHPACLHFHHLDGSEKDTTIAKAVHDAWAIERIKTEMDKCIVLCANCHAKEHWSDNFDIEG